MLNAGIAQGVIDHALHLGADFGEVFVEHHLSSQVELLSGKVDAINSGIDFGIGIRLFVGKRILYGYTNQADLDELMRITSDLIANDTGLPSRQAPSFLQTQSPSNHPTTSPLKKDSCLDQKIEYLHKMNGIARAQSDKIQQFIGKVLQREQAIEIFNSDGLHIQDTRHYCRLVAMAVAQDGQNQSTGYTMPGALKGWEFHGDIDPQAIAVEAVRGALVTLSADDCPSGEMPVVIGNGFGGVIFHEACGHLLETTAVAKQASVFHDQMEQMIAHPVVSAVDDGTMSGEWGSINIDDEGMQTQRTQLIKDGRLVNFLADRMGAQTTGFPRTGSGRRQSYKFAPASRMRNTFIEPGESTLEEMISTIEHGIYAKKMGGGSVMPGTGEFNFAVQEPYLIENGKITKPLKSATLISTGPEVLKQISMVGKDFALAAGMCGSVSGAIPTTVGQPALKVDKILVGGQGS
jgi:TldD protein